MQCKTNSLPTIVTCANECSVRWLTGVAARLLTSRSLMMSPMFMLHSRFMRELRRIWQWFLSLGPNMVSDTRVRNVDFAMAPGPHGRSFPRMVASFTGMRPEVADHCGNRASTMRSAPAVDCSNNLNSFYETSRYTAALGPPFPARSAPSPTWRRRAGLRHTPAEAARKAVPLAEDHRLFHG